MEKKTGLFNEGTVLIIALITVTFLGAVAVAVMAPVGTASKVSTTAYNSIQATLVANSVAERVKAIMCKDGATPDEGTSLCLQGWTAINSFEGNGGVDEPGITYPVVDFVDDIGNYVFDTNITDPNYPRFFPVDDSEVRYIAYTVEDTNGNAMSYVSAEFNGVVRNIRVVYRREAVPVPQNPPNPLYTLWNKVKSAFGDAGVTLNSSAWTDSYNSNEADYPNDPPDVNNPAGVEGSTATNRSIFLNNNTTIWGQAIAGPVGVESDGIDNDNNGIVDDEDPNTVNRNGSVNVSEGEDNLEETISFPPIEIPDDIPSNGSLSIAKDTVETIGPGDFNYQDVSFSKNGTLNIVGPTTIVLNGNWSMARDASINIDASNGTVTIFGAEGSSFVMSNATSITNNSNKPENFKIFTDGYFEYNSDATLYGTVYAPNVDIVVSSGAQIFGGLIGKSVSLSSGTSIHWDKALQEADFQDDFDMSEYQNPDLENVQYEYTGSYGQSSFQYLE